MYKIIKVKSVGEAVEKGMQLLLKEGHVEHRENQNKQDFCLEMPIIIDVYEPDSEPFISRSICTDLKGLAKYDDEFLEGTADDLGWKYTYHQLYAQFYDKLINEFKRNIHTRRGCIALGQGDINFTEDPPCLQLIMCNYVNEKLEMTAVFRSNDAVKAFPMNIHAIEMLHEKICEDLGIKVGELHYIANNFHAYSKDLNLLNKYCDIFINGTNKRRFSSREDLESAREEK